MSGGCILKQWMSCEAGHPLLYKDGCYEEELY